MSRTPVYSPEILGKNVRYERAVMKKWDLGQLGARSGVHRTHIARIERAEREPTIGVLLKLCWALDVTIEDLLRPPRRQRLMERLEQDALLQRMWKRGAEHLVSESTTREA
jgi:transcriptional regulator with XRE-family HTH domain